MGFAYAYLHDDGAFILFYPDNLMIRKEISSYFKNYKMKVLDEWTIINYLHLANPVVPTKNVCFVPLSPFFYSFLVDFSFNFIILQFSTSFTFADFEVQGYPYCPSYPFR